MKWYSTFIICILGLSLASAARAAATCQQTGFFVDSINMTAAQLGGDVTGALDATGCNIGVFYDNTHTGNVTNADISGANYFGVVVDGDAGAVAVNVTSSQIHDIGESPLNGSQHGNAIFYMNASGNAAADDSRTCNDNTHAVTGTISGNTVTAYQKNGITVKCPGASVDISGNTVTGAEDATFIAQNGIEVGVGATGQISSNTVSENEYTGLNGAASTGVLIFGGTAFGGALTKNVSVSSNTITDSDVGIDSVNCNDADCDKAPAADTNIGIHGNALTNPDVSNLSGCGGSQGYQAGIQDLGHNDKISGNKISGTGYTVNKIACGGSTTAAVFAIDTAGSVAKVHAHP